MATGIGHIEEWPRYQGGGKSLARPTSQCILMVRLFRLMLVLLYIYINSTNIPPIMIISRAFSTQVRGFKPSRSRRIFKVEKILSTPSFVGEVKPSVPCRRFAACERSLNGVEVVISAKLPDNILAHSSHFRRWDLSRRGGRGGTWW